MSRNLFNHKILLWHEMDAGYGKSLTSVSLQCRVREILEWFIVQGPVVRRLDNAIQRINHYQWISVSKTNHAIHWIVIYPVDSVIQPLNNRAQFGFCALSDWLKSNVL